jgi:predicted dehydrogenase
MGGSATVYRAGIVGCGRKAATLDDEDRCRVNYSIPPDAHAGAYAQVPRARLVAAADPNEAKRRLMQERWGVAAVYADYREMLARERLDLISVTTRADRHAEVTIAAAEAGVHGVLCEKAMATSLQEADAMLEACERAGTRLSVNHTRRWHPTFERAADALRAGVIGDLRCIVGTCPGPLIHNGTHLFDLMRLFGGEVAWVSGTVRAGAAPDAPGWATLQFHGGVVGFADVDGQLGLGLELQGVAGRMFIDSAEDGVSMWEYREPAAAAGAGAWYQGGPCRERRTRHLAGGPGRGTLVAAIEELIAAIEDGRPGRSSGQDGRAALEIALAVHESHTRGGQRVELPLRNRARAVVSR